MVRSRTVTALAGLALSLLVTVAAYVYFDTLFVFLFLPFVPFLFARGRGDDGDAERTAYECPTCGFRTADSGFAYCPRDGTELETVRG